MSDIKKINGRYYDFGTKNVSFLQTAMDLQALGVKNYYFMLEVKNPHSGVADMNPYMSKPAPQQMRAMLEEARSNVWYFCREIARIPIQGGSSVPYGLHRGLAASIWCFDHGFDSCLCIPRQCYKTSGILAGPIAWAYLVGTSNSRFHFFGKDSKNTKENLSNLKEYIKALPEWIRMERKIDTSGREQRSRLNQEYIQNVILNNRVTISAEPRNLEHAQSLARGLAVPVLYFDELEFTPYIDVIMSNSAPAFKTAADNAKQNGAAYGRIMTSTPGDLDTPSGRAANEIIGSMVPWSEAIYSKSEEEVHEYIETAMKKYEDENVSEDRGGLQVFYIEYQWYQIHKTQQWLNELKRSIGKRMVVRRELFLQRLRGSSESPIDPEDLDNLIANMKKHTRDVLLLGKFQMIVYPHGQPNSNVHAFDKTIPYMIGIDCATGKGRDYTAITVVNPYNLQIAAEFRYNYIGTTDLFRAIMDLIINYIPKGVIIVEQNATGIVLIEMILESAIKPNLYFHSSTTMVKHLAEESSSDYMLRTLSEEKKKYGTWVNKTVRDMLFEILFKYVVEYPDIINGEFLVDGICQLIVTKTGRVDHAVGGHDDCVFSWMHIMFVWEYGDNLEFFGIEKDRHNHPLLGDYELPITDPIMLGENTNAFHPTAVTYESTLREHEIAMSNAMRSVVSNPRLNISSADYVPYGDHEEVMIPDSFFDNLNGVF
jgi:hypothetical protein